MAKVMHLALDRWSFGRTSASGFPVGFLPRVMKELYRGGPMLHVCCGTVRIPGAVNLDINPELRPDVVGHAEQLPFATGVFEFVLADPPYEQYDSQRLYGTGQPRLYRLLAELSRVTRPLGRYALLYPFSPITLAGDTREVEIAVTLPVHMRPRMFNVFIRGFWPGMVPHQYDGELVKLLKSKAKLTGRRTCVVCQEKSTTRCKTCGRPLHEAFGCSGRHRCEVATGG